VPAAALRTSDSNVGQVLQGSWRHSTPKQCRCPSALA
jgi:hypothetical protein